MDIILKLYQEKATVFTFKEIKLLFPKERPISLKNKLSYAARTGKLLHLRRGIYAKPDFDPYELTNKLYTPSYISLETVLFKSGIIFQAYKTIFAVSYLTREIKVKNIKISYRKIKDSILLNRTGVINKGNYSIATKERAFLDAVFLYPNYHFDNLSLINWQIVFKMATTIYKNKAMEQRLKSYYQQVTR